MLAAMSRPPIPEPRLHTMRNVTPFSAFQCDKMAPGRKFYDIMVVKGTFTLAPGKLELAKEQREVALADDHWELDAPVRASLKQPGDALLLKPSTDVIITGTARPPGKEPRCAWDAAIVVRGRGETVLEYRAQVLGPRRWRHRGEGGWALTDPEPTGEVPIRYELAYGGAYPAAAPPEGEPEPPWVVHAPNPSGTGFFDEGAMDPGVEYRAPQWQPHAHPVTDMNREVPLTGFGPIARPWSSRLRFAGTYDEAWERATRIDVENGLPADYAADFDPRLFQCAHPDLIARSYLKGDEEITLTGVVPGEDPFTMRLPDKRVEARLFDGKGGSHGGRMLLDTVHIDVDEGVVYVCWRITLDQGRDIRTALIFSTEGA